MPDYRKNVKVWSATKTNLEALKDRLKMKAEADVIAYLLAHYNDTWQTITLKQDQDYKQNVELERNQHII